MKSPLVCRMKAYIQPFERALALAELGALGKSSPLPLDKQAECPVLFPCRQL